MTQDGNLSRLEGDNVKFDLAQLANFGEFIGGAAVLVTLIYLVVEAKRGRHAVEAASVDALSAGWNTINAVVFGNRELSEILLRGSLDPQSLDPVETVQFVGIINSYINHFQTLKRRYDSGLMPSKEWENNA